MIDPDQIQIGTLLKIYDPRTEGDMFALVIDIDDDQENPILFHILIGDKTYWEYLRVKGWEIIK
jgi:hypothetical protein